jgi:hypothetical protein
MTSPRETTVAAVYCIILHYCSRLLNPAKTLYYHILHRAEIRVCYHISRAFDAAAMVGAFGHFFVGQFAGLFIGIFGRQGS